MRRDAIVIACALAACGDTTRVPEPTATPPPRRELPMLRGTPTASSIVHVALTERGDAALTIDTLDEIRLWPALDGTRQPVPVWGASPVAAALARVGDDLVAAIRDEAGGAELQRFRRDGMLLGRTTIDGDTAVEEIVAIGARFLVARADQTVELYDANGARLARLAALPDEHVAAIAVRHDGALALVGADPAAPDMVRWLVVDDGLRWGAASRLVAAVMPRRFALAPGLRRIAAVDPRAQTLVVYDLAPIPGPARGGPPFTITDDITFGFSDDDHVMIANHGVIDWWASPDRDPWGAPAGPSPDPDSTGAAVADGIAVIGHGLSLAIDDLAHVRYLGWGALAAGDLETGELATAGDELVLRSVRELTWLDASLAPVRRADLDKLSVGPASARGAPVGAHHVVLVTTQTKPEIELVDLDHPDKPLVLGTVSDAQVVVNNDTDGTLAVFSPSLRDLPRWHLDLAHTSATRLPDIHFDGETMSLHVLDPGVADGVVAVTWDSRGKAHWFRPLSPGAPPSVVATRPLRGEVLAVDARGTLYEKRSRPDAITIQRALLDETWAQTDSEIVAIATSRDATRIAVITRGQLAVLDDAGHVVWRRPLWGGLQARFFAGDRRIVVNTGGGLVSYDAASGTQLGTTCGWDFGLHDDPSQRVVFGQPTACEDAPQQ